MTTTRTRRAAPIDSAPRRADNEVFLRGRLGAEAELRTLPSGDELCSFRLTVARCEPAGSRGSRATVDSIDCVTSAARARRCLEKAVPGAELEVTGTLRRRFWRAAAGGVASRYEVLVSTARVTAAPEPVSAAPRRRRSGA